LDKPHLETSFLGEVIEDQGIDVVNESHEGGACQREEGRSGEVSVPVPSWVQGHSVGDAGHTVDNAVDEPQERAHPPVVFQDVALGDDQVDVREKEWEHVDHKVVHFDEVVILGVAEIWVNLWSKDGPEQNSNDETKACRKFTPDHSFLSGFDVITISWCATPENNHQV
jgi:hypothetical protein